MYFTIKTRERGESSLSFSPDRGGIITSMKLRGKELLYLDEETFNDPNKNVRGGIPILFPNAGPLEESDQYSLNQHGFARISKWSEELSGKSEFIETLKSSEETKEQYLYDCEIQIKGSLEDDGSVTIEQTVMNNEIEKEMPVSMGLHPYFKVPHAEKSEIRFDFEGGDSVERDVENWSNDGTTSIENPKCKYSEAVLRVIIPKLGTLIMDVSSEYKRIWIWSQPGKDFVCIEPIMRDNNGLLDDPEMVKPKESYVGRVNYRLEE